MKLKEMMQWLLKLLPKQKMQDNGSGNLQAGRVDGDLHHSHTQAVYHIYMMDRGAAPTQSQAQPQSSQVPEQPPVQVCEQLPADGWYEVLAMIRNLPAREGESVFRFMERKFSTRMVRNLKASELQEVRWYAAKVTSNLANRSRQKREIHR